MQNINKQPIGRLGATVSVEYSPNETLPFIWLRDDGCTMLLLTHEARDLRDLLNTLPLDS